LNGEEWQPVQDFIRAHRRGSEPICFLPAWTRGHAVDQYKFNGIETLRAPEDAFRDREPLAGFWVVSQFEAFDPRDVPASIYPHRLRRRLGAADIHLFRRQPIPDVPDSLVSHLAEATCVHHGPTGRRTTLVWDRIGYSAPGGRIDGLDVGYLGCRVTHDRFAGRPQFGIWFHPPPPGQALSITWPRVQVLPWLEVSGGLRDEVAGRGAPVKLQVILSGRTIASLVFSAQRGFKTYALRSPREAGTGRLSFKVTTTDNHGRHFMFDAAFRRTRSRGSLDPGGAPPAARPGRLGTSSSPRVRSKATALSPAAPALRP
jgi:hypothetical protein